MIRGEVAVLGAQEGPDRSCCPRAPRHLPVCTEMWCNVH